MAALSGAACGCAPRELLPRPANWPAAWAERRLFHTPQALIYAGSPGAAGEADRLLASVAGEFAADTTEAAAKGLLIVTDTGDALFTTSRQALLDLAAASPQSWMEPAARKRATEDDAECETREEVDLGAELLPQRTCFPIATHELHPRLGLPASTSEIVWALAVPTVAACRHAAREMIAGALKREKITLAERLLIAPWIPLVESLTADALAEQRRVAIYTCLVDTVAGWSPEQRRARLADYCSRHEAEFGRRLAAAHPALLSVSSDGDTNETSPQPPASQPASQPAHE